MKYGIVSDVHSNLAALEAVLNCFRDEAVSEIICLGDMVGYNAEPQACVEALAGSQAPADREVARRAGSASSFGQSTIKSISGRWSISWQMASPELLKKSCSLKMVAISPIRVTRAVRLNP